MDGRPAGRPYGPTVVVSPATLSDWLPLRRRSAMLLRAADSKELAMARTPDIADHAARAEAGAAQA